MTPLVRSRTLVTEHAALEQLLDDLITTVCDGEDAREPFQRAFDALRRHYLGEDEFFAGLLTSLGGPAQKMLHQHRDVLELAVQVEMSYEAGQMSDGLTLMRRFHALAQHNIIEEERDVFPLLSEL